MQPPFGQWKTVVEGQLLTGPNIPARDDPDVSADVFRAAVGRAGMVDQPGRAGGVARVEIVALIQLENRDAAVLAGAGARESLQLAPAGLRLGDAFPCVFDDFGAGGNRGARVDAAAVDG